MSLPSLQLLPKRFTGLIGLALGDIQSRDISSLRNATRKGLGTVTSTILCEELVTLVRQYGAPTIDVVSDVEPYRFYAHGVEFAVCVMRPKNLAARHDIIPFDPRRYKGNQVRRHVLNRIDETSRYLNALHCSDGTRLLPFRVTPLALIAVGMDFVKRTTEPRLELRAAWIGYPTNFDTVTKQITAWHDDIVQITPQHDLMAVLDEQSEIRDEAIPPIDNILPFRHREEGNE